MHVRLIALTGWCLAAAACSTSPMAAKSEEPMATPTKAPEAHMAAMSPNYGAMPQDDMVKLALSAGPSDITAHAAVIDMSESGQMKEVRPGTNGWVCMAHPEVMCVDKEWQGFLDAYVNKKDPQVKTVGIGYMLRGDQGASNTDPFAMKATPDNQWVVSPPHVMLLTPDARQLDALPTDFRGGGPWVMWKGTKYAHIMVPTAPMAMPMGAGQ